MAKSTKVKLTQAVIAKALANREKAQRLGDTVVAGLELRVGPRSATYYLHYKPTGRRPDGRQHASQSLKIGTPTSHSIAEVRKEAERIKLDVSAGRDPAEEKKKAKAARALAETRKSTMKDAAETYIVRSVKGTERHVTTESGALRLAIQEMGVEDTAPADVTVADILRMLSHNSGRACAVHRYGSLNRFFDDLLAHQAVDLNPCAAVPKRLRPKPPAPRTRFYIANEVQALWNTTGLTGVQLRFLRACILLPLRFGELCELVEGEVDLAHNRLTLSGKRTKNGDSFSMPVPDTAQSLLTDTGTAADPRIFPLCSAGKTFKSWSSLTKRIRTGSGVADFNFHDLRRTFTTVLADHGIGDASVADALLNHRQSATRGGVIAAYNHAALWPQKAQLMETWGKMVVNAVRHGTWTSGSSVTQLRASSSS